MMANARVRRLSPLMEYDVVASSRSAKWQSRDRRRRRCWRLVAHRLAGWCVVLLAWVCVGWIPWEEMRLALERGAPAGACEGHTCGSERELGQLPTSVEELRVWLADTWVVDPDRTDAVMPESERASVRDILATTSMTITFRADGSAVSSVAVRAQAEVELMTWTVRDVTEDGAQLMVHASYADGVVAMRRVTLEFLDANAFIAHEAGEPMRLVLVRASSITSDPASPADAGNQEEVAEVDGSGSLREGLCDGAPTVACGAQVHRTMGCIACHATEHAGTMVGPSHLGLFGSTTRSIDGRTLVVDEAHLRESILAPTAFIREGFHPHMPAFDGHISENDLDALVLYLISLGDS